MIADRTGDRDEATARCREAVHVIDRSDMIWQQGDIRRWAAAIAVRRGDAGEARRLLDEALALYAAKEMVYWAGVVEDRLADL